MAQRIEQRAGNQQGMSVLLTSRRPNDRCKRAPIAIHNRADGRSRNQRHVNQGDERCDDARPVDNLQPRQH